MISASKEEWMIKTDQSQNGTTMAESAPLPAGKIAARAMLPRKLPKVKSERGLKPLPDGRCVYQFLDADKHYHRYTARNKSEARALLEREKTKVREGKFADPKAATKFSFEEGVRNFLSNGEIELQPSTHKRDTEFAARWLATPRFKGKALSRITADDVTAFKQSEKTRVSKKTVDNSLARLKRMFNLAIKKKMCTANPVLDVRFFRPESQRMRILKPDEEQRLLEAADPIMGAMILFSLDTGMRVGETVKLRMDALDLEAGSVEVHAVTSKSKRSRRLPLSSNIIAVLQDLTAGIAPSGLVFEEFDGEAKRKFYYRWTKLREAVGLQDLRWHDLRHTFATRQAFSGTNPYALMYLLGHTTLSMVLKYVHMAEIFAVGPHRRSARQNLHESCTREPAPEIQYGVQ